MPIKAPTKAQKTAAPSKAVKPTKKEPSKKAAKSSAPPEKPVKGEKKIKLPTKLAAVADLLWSTRQERLAMAKKLDELKRVERSCEDLLINKLPKDDATGVAGSLARATIEVDAVPIIVDEKKLMAYVNKTGETDLLQKPKLSSTAVRLRWDNKKSVPGVGVFNAVKVHLNKVK